ncbi:replicative DNA helicase [Pseudoxanthomonas winnipegensis]|uniref:Replicative DNA helicase n=1 Tax=Pseudoxanthomonas winnipegensis TaxID=2480810 RepID=A0A4Q8LZR3_9GAMM|nr:replicative DNA helicase [Pseudoxanthomonas winnipegensis]RZZ90621.1 replicative DNA helicase [Pseudoxanthomonas winnipegensis]TAA37224.1 replicative DNA helicase [Pseudoxanthomonas winnipegensis]
MNGHDEAEHLAGLYGEPARRDHVTQLRTPPFSLDAEQHVLGAILLVDRAWWDVADVLRAEDFYRRDHQLIWTAMKELRDARQPIDWSTVGNWFDSRGISDDIVGGAYLIELGANVPSASNVRAYAEIVADKARLRRLIDVGTEMVNAGFNPEGRDSVELVGEAQSRIGGLLDTEPCDLESVAPVMQRVYARLEDRSRSGQRLLGLSTGIGELDKILHGLCPGGLYVLAARPKMGKTTLAQNITEHCALVARKAVAVFSFEMQPEELGDRMLASIGGINGNRLRSGELDDIDWSNATQAMAKLQGARIFVSKPRNARVEHVVAQVRRQHAREPLGLVVIDYLQLMTVSGDNRAQGIGDITRALKLMASELNVPVLLLSQLNRDVEKRTDKRPIVADLRDSGSIEQDADAVIFIYRDEVYHRESPDRGLAELIVAIQRAGAPGDCKALYVPEQFRFSDVPDYWQPYRPAAQDKPAPKPRGFKRPQAARQEVD